MMMSILYYTIILMLGWQGPTDKVATQPEQLKGNWKLISIFVDESSGLLVRPEDLRDEQCVIRFETDEEGSRFSGKTAMNQIFGNYEVHPGDNYNLLKIGEFGSTKVLERGFGGQMMRHLPQMSSVWLHQEIGILEMKTSEGVIFQFQAVE